MQLPTVNFSGNEIFLVLTEKNFMNIFRIVVLSIVVEGGGGGGGVVLAGC